MRRVRPVLQRTLLMVIAVGLLILPKSSAVAVTPVFTCETNPLAANLITLTSQAHWADWIEKLSGEESIEINGSPYTIDTRYSPSLFAIQNDHAKAYEYVLDIIRGWYDDEQIEEDPFPYGSYTWKNIILTIPGSTKPEETVILSAHLDSTSNNPGVDAPGAEDNASGSAALLEAARLLQDVHFERSIRLIWFTGEEQGLYGSRAYVEDHDLSGVVGVLNLDMYGYDHDADRCFEMHVGTLAASNEVGTCFAETIQAYGLPLSFDYLTNGATSASDHSSFWNEGVGAVEISENFGYENLPGGCIGDDSNPYYHTVYDTIDNMNLSSGFEITKAALLTLFNMAGEGPPVFFTYLPLMGR